MPIHLKCSKKAESDKCAKRLYRNYCNCRRNIPCRRIESAQNRHGIRHGNIIHVTLPYTTEGWRQMLFHAYFEASQLPTDPNLRTLTPAGARPPYPHPQGPKGHATPIPGTPMRCQAVLWDTIPGHFAEREVLGDGRKWGSGGVGRVGWKMGRYCKWASKWIVAWTGQSKR